MTFPTTESDPRYIALYNQAREGQAVWSWLESAPDDEVLYLAGMTFQGHADLSEAQRTKLQGNANRAALEMHRRWDERHAKRAQWTALGAAVIGVAGTALGFLIG